MKQLLGLLAATCLMSACASIGNGLPHADSDAVVPQSAGPTLCRGGTAPPCNDR
jgi:hypothetical protein